MLKSNDTILIFFGISWKFRHQRGWASLPAQVEVFAFLFAPNSQHPWMEDIFFFFFFELS